jgi:ABC-2 type transport system ATP-binding protein
MNAEAFAGLAPDGPIRCSGITKRQSHDWVLRGVDLQVERGDVLGLIGRNGAGKSTLIRILLGLEQPTEGLSFVFNEPSLQLGDGSKARLGYVPQQPDAFAWMRVGDMLDFVGRQYARWDAKLVDAFLGKWQLSRERVLAKLSPGERQRIAIVRALATTPDLLVLDEPASALDPAARRDLLREIVTRAADVGTTVLFSTNIVQDLERVASRVALLHDSRLVIDTPLDEFADTHARLILPAEEAATLSRKVPGEISRRRSADGSVSLVLARESGASWPALANTPGSRLDVLSLEDLFVEVAG